MFLKIADRPSDSPYVERVWRCHSERPGRMYSVASSHWEMVVTRFRGETTFTLRGPETKATELDCPGDCEWIGVRFKLGTYMPQLPVAKLIDHQDVTLRGNNAYSFWFGGSEWECPSFENAETFVGRLCLVRGNLLTRDRIVEAAIMGEAKAMSLRSAQRHFLLSTGMSHTTFRQIQRARRAALLLKQGVPILDATDEAGFYDQAHLTRSLRRLIGLTPAKILRQEAQLSFLYNT